MAWAEHHGTGWRVAERTAAGRRKVAFATRADADRFVELVRLVGWDAACAFVADNTDRAEHRAGADPASPATTVSQTGTDRAVRSGAGTSPSAPVPARVPDTPLPGLRAAGVSVGDLCRAFIADRAATGVATTQYDSYLRLHVDPYFGDIDAGYVLSRQHAGDPSLPTAAAFTAHLLTAARHTRPGTGAGASRTRPATLSPKTVRNVVMFVSAAYNLARRADVCPLVDRNPFAGAAPSGRGGQEISARDVLTAQQATALLDVLAARSDYAYPLVLLLLLTGLRWGEAVGLQAKRVHLDGPDPYLEVVTALKLRPRADGGGTYLGRLKSRASRRTLGVPPMLAPRPPHHRRTTSQHRHDRHQARPPPGASAVELGLSDPRSTTRPGSKSR